MQVIFESDAFHLVYSPTKYSTRLARFQYLVINPGPETNSNYLRFSKLRLSRAALISTGCNAPRSDARIEAVLMQCRDNIVSK